MIGSEYSFTHLNPTSMLESDLTANDDSHAGTINVRSIASYALYGLSNSINLLAKVPYEYWRQNAEHPDNHHRTQTIKGMSDLELGFRWLIINQAMGPGHLFFTGWSLTFPTGSSYAINPFADNADSTEHTHIAIGAGHPTSSLYLEWWYRSEFPFVVGLSSQYNFPIGESTIGFKSGRKLSLNLQAIYQKALMWRIYPYLKLKIRQEFSDRWAGEKAKNSGGIFINGALALVFELSETVSAIPIIDFELWRSVAGDQLNGFTVGFSFRKTIN